MQYFLADIHTQEEIRAYRLMASYWLFLLIEGIVADCWWSQILSMVT